MTAEQEKVIADINALAREMVNYDFADKNKEDCKTLKETILEKILSLAESKWNARNGDENLYFPAFNMNIPWNLLIDVSKKLLSMGKDDEGDGWHFNPDRAEFTRYMLYLIKRRRNNAEYYDDPFNETISLDEERDGIPPLKQTLPSPDENPEQSILRKEMEKSLDFAKILEDYYRAFKDQDISKSENKKCASYFPGFFTYFRTKDIKIGSETATAEDYQEVARTYGEELFRWMLITMLEFLMEGAFSSINDVIENSLRERIDIRQIQKNLAKFNTCSRQTISKYIHAYQAVEDNVLHSIKH